MSDGKILKLKHSIQTELIEVNVILEQILLELSEIARLSQPDGRLGRALKKAKGSFVPLFATLNIVADNLEEEEGQAP